MKLTEVCHHRQRIQYNIAEPLYVQYKTMARFRNTVPYKETWCIITKARNRIQNQSTKYSNTTHHNKKPHRTNTS